MADFEELKNELIKSYQDLLELQYHEKPKAREHIKTICESLIADMVLWKIQEQCMDVDISVGVQLDIIGKWVDIDRYFKGNKYDNNKWYAYYDWDEKDQPNSLQGGMWDWDTSEKPNNAPFLNYDWILVIKNKINDDDFRTLIKLKIIKNNTNATCKNIDDEIYKLFKGVIYTVWGEQVFDLSKFTVVGSPTITDEGIASGFSNRDYIKIPYEWAKNVTNFKIKGKFKVENSVQDTNFILGYVTDGYSMGLSFNSTGIQWFAIKTSSEEVNLYQRYSITPNIDYSYELQLNNNLYTFRLFDDTGSAVVNLSQSTSSPFNITDNYLRLGVSGNYYPLNFMTGSIDLKQFSITVDGKEVFSGVKDKVMELTYKYPEYQTSIMNLAKTKNCLPCPSGVHLKMEGIPDNE